MLFILLTYLIVFRIALVRYKISKGVITFSILLNSVFVFIHYFEIDSPLIVSDSEYFIEKMEEYNKIGVFHLISHAWLYLDEFYAFILSIVLRPIGINLAVIICLNIIMYFLAIFNLYELFEKYSQNKELKLFLLVISTNYSMSTFVPQILREIPIIFLLSLLLKYLFDRSFVKAFVVCILLTLFHGAFAALILVLIIYILMQKGEMKLKLGIIGISVLMILYILENGINIYKLNFTKETLLEGIALSNNIIGSAGSVLEGSYRKELIFDSFLDYITHLPEYLLPFLFKPFFWERAAISSPVNFYKSFGSVLLLTCYVSNTFLMKLKGKHVILLIMMSILIVFAASTSQYGQAFRHLNKFFLLFQTVILLQTAGGTITYTRRWLYLFLAWNVFFILLLMLALIV